MAPQPLLAIAAGTAHGPPCSTAASWHLQVQPLQPLAHLRGLGLQVSVLSGSTCHATHDGQRASSDCWHCRSDPSGAWWAGHMQLSPKHLYVRDASRARKFYIERLRLSLAVAICTADLLPRWVWQRCRACGTTPCTGACCFPPPPCSRHGHELQAPMVDYGLDLHRSRPSNIAGRRQRCASASPSLVGVLACRQLQQQRYL